MTAILSLSLSHSRCSLAHAHYRTQNDGTNLKITFELMLIECEIICSSAVNGIEMCVRENTFYA